MLVTIVNLVIQAARNQEMVKFQTFRTITKYPVYSSFHPTPPESHLPVV